MPERSIPQTTPPMVEVSYAEGDPVRIVSTQTKDNPHRGKTGTIDHIGHSTGLLIDSVPLYFVNIPGEEKPLVFLIDEIEPVTPEDRGEV